MTLACVVADVAAETPVSEVTVADSVVEAAEIVDVDSGEDVWACTVVVITALIDVNSKPVVALSVDSVVDSVVIVVSIVVDVIVDNIVETASVVIMSVDVTVEVSVVISEFFVVDSDAIVETPESTVVS